MQRMDLMVTVMAMVMVTDLPRGTTWTIEFKFKSIGVFLVLKCSSSSSISSISISSSSDVSISTRKAKVKVASHSTQLVKRPQCDLKNGHTATIH
jgi:hypothetical protein